MTAPGDLFVLPETAGFPVEWAILAREPGDTGRLLAILADTQPLAGSADVEVPPNEPAGPLSLRCRFGTWVDATRFDAARRTGTLSPDAVDRALRRRSELETGDLKVSPLAYEADVDPEYEDWVRDVLVPAQAALAESSKKREPSSVVRPLRRWTSFGNPYALAASILLMVTIGLAGGLLWQGNRLSDLATERQRTADELRQERARSAAELKKAQEDHQRAIAERDREAAKRLESEQQRIADLEQRLESASRTRPLIDAPYVWLSEREPVRGEEEGISIPAEAPYLFTILFVSNSALFPEYRLEIRDKDTGRTVWQTAGLHKKDDGTVSVALPRDLLPPGAYRLRLYGLKRGKAEMAGEYDLRIARG
jgi:hypothetical protein